MTKYHKLDKDELLQIGDIVVSSHPLAGKHKRTITRLTAKFAFAKIRDDYEVKYPIKYDIYFQSLPRQNYNQTNYDIYRQVV